MAAGSDILELSKVIGSRVAELDGYLRAEPVPNSAQNADAFLPTTMSAQMQQTKDEILVAMDQLKVLLQGPLENLVDICGLKHINTMPALDIAVQYQISSHIKPEEELTYQRLSERCHLNEVDLQRAVRMLISVGLFAEPRKGIVTHNASSKMLHDSPALSDWLTYMTRFVWPVSLLTTEAISRWPDAQELNKTAFCLHRGETFWNSLRNDRGNARLFTAAMNFLQSNPKFGSHHLVRDLEWDQGWCPQSLVDIGGHTGAIASEILRSYPITKCVVQDFPEVVATATIPNDLQGRLEFEAHDFFTPQSTKADVYLLRSICHDWSDKYAGKIISNLVPALEPGARVIVNEVCMPDPGMVPRYTEAGLRGYDMCMKQFFNSKERTIEEWLALFQNCDRRFRLERVKMSPGSVLAVIEFVWNA